jgi:hypothetical protein
VERAQQQFVPITRFRFVVMLKMSDSFFVDGKDLDFSLVRTLGFQNGRGTHLLWKRLAWNDDIGLKM